MSGSYGSNATNSNILRRIYQDSSDDSSDEAIPQFTHLGRRDVPITYTCQELVDTIESQHWDCLFIAEVIRRSKVYFPDHQLVLIQEVLDATELIEEFGYYQPFNDELGIFEEGLKLRLGAEKAFFSQQKRRQIHIYEIMELSSFPYSVSQSACLKRMRRALLELKGDPSAKADRVFEVTLRNLVRLLRLNDHLNDSNPHRMVVTSTIHFYLNDMLIKLVSLANEERGRPRPDFIHPNSRINLAVYLVESLVELVDVTKLLHPKEHFHFGMVEIYSRVVRIFRKSGLELSDAQNEALQIMEGRVRDLEEHPLMRQHHMIVEACLDFMDKLRENTFNREYKQENGKWVLASEGEINKAIREISWDLIYLQPVVADHLTNFPTFGNGVENIIARMMECFLRLYPMH